MKKIILFLLFFTYSRFSFGQIRVFPEIVDRIPQTISDGPFVDTLEKFFNNLILNQADSVFLLYPYIQGQNFATIFWKKNDSFHCSAIFQINPNEGGKIKVKQIINPVLNSISIMSFYVLMEDSTVRMIDTTMYFSHQEPTYCKFYFENRESIFVGFSAYVFGSMGLVFWNAYAKEYSSLILNEKKRTSKN